MKTIALLISLLSADPPNVIRYRPGDVRPIPRSTNCKHVKMYYGDKRPTCTYITLSRISFDSPFADAEDLRLQACTMQADAVIFTHRVGHEWSGIPVRCNVPFLLPSDFKVRQ